MVKFKDIDENKLYIYGTGCLQLLNQVDVISTTTYENGPALIVRKEKTEKKKNKFNKKLHSLKKSNRNSIAFLFFGLRNKRS